MNDADLATMIARAKDGDPEAVAALKQFEDDIRMMVRVRLPRSLRSKFDSMDFVQQVWESFLSDVNRAPGHFTDLAQIRSYLAGMARNKVLEEHRRHTQVQKYNVDREEPIFVRRGGQDVPRELPAHDPTPSQDIQAQDRLDQLTAGRNPRDAKVIALRSQGLSFEEIAEKTGLHERTVRRIIDSLRKRMGNDLWQ